MKKERKKQCFLQMVTYRRKNNYVSGQNQCHTYFVGQPSKVFFSAVIHISVKVENNI